MQCGLCAMGTFQNVTGQTECLQCPPGTHLNKTGGVKEEDCFQCEMVGPGDFHFRNPRDGRLDDNIRELWWIPPYTTQSSDSMIIARPQNLVVSMALHTRRVIHGARDPFLK